jgi:hypothetical protein
MEIAIHRVAGAKTHPTFMSSTSGQIAAAADMIDCLDKLPIDKVPAILKGVTGTARLLKYASYLTGDVGRGNANNQTIIKEQFIDVATDPKLGLPTLGTFERGYSNRKMVQTPPVDDAPGAKRGASSAVGAPSDKRRRAGSN